MKKAHSRSETPIKTQTYVGGTRKKVEQVSDRPSCPGILSAIAWMMVLAGCIFYGMVEQSRPAKRIENKTEVGDSGFGFRKALIERLRATREISSRDVSKQIARMIRWLEGNEQ